jgi:hypothetical protein
MADASIYNQFLRPVKSVDEYSAEMDQRDLRRTMLEGAQRQNALQALTVQQQMEDRNALQRVASGWKGDTTPDQRIAALRNSGNASLMSQADALEKQWLDRQKTQADVGKTGAETNASQFKLQQDKQKAAISRVAAYATPDDVAADLNGAVSRGEVPMQIATLMLKTMPQDPAQFDAWKLRQIVAMNDPAKMAEMLKPHLQTNNTGGETVTQAINPMTGAVVNTTRIRNTQSPDNAATQATAIRGQNLTDARARESNAAALSKPFEVTGTDGAPMLVQQTKDGKIVPVQGFAPKGATGGKVGEAKEALALLDQAEPLIKGATGSTIGAALDGVAQFFGSATPGSIKAQQLKAIEGALVAKMPKMSGPQSDKDVLLYRQMAAEIGDPTVPYERKAAAMGTVREIQERYAGMTPGGSKQTAAPGAGAPTKITDDAGYNALPSGSLFVGPDGKTRRKP